MNSLAIAHDCVEAGPRDQLTAAERADMFELLGAHFDGVTAAQFDDDLSKKNWVLRLFRGERLVGFSTLQVYPAETERGPIHVFYSGDTIVAPEAWDSPQLARGWIGLVKRIQTTLEPWPSYWLLLSSGFRTYRFLPVFWKSFWPRFDQDMPKFAGRLRAHLARAQFGACFDEERGIVRFSRPQKLKPALSSVPPGKNRDPHVEFFLRENPGYKLGDELVCLTELSDDNLTRAGERMVRTAR